MKIKSSLININLSITVIPEKLNPSVNLEKKFQKDFDERFGGLVIVDDETAMKANMLRTTCSRRQIRIWIDQWISRNADLDDDFKRTADAFLEKQFKRSSHE